MPERTRPNLKSLSKYRRYRLRKAIESISSKLPLVASETNRTKIFSIRASAKRGSISKTEYKRLVKISKQLETATSPELYVEKKFKSHFGASEKGRIVLGLVKKGRQEGLKVGEHTLSEENYLYEDLLAFMKSEDDFDSQGQSEWWARHKETINDLNYYNQKRAKGEPITQEDFNNIVDLYAKMDLASRERRAIRSLQSWDK